MMLATSWCGGMGVGGWLLMAGLWAGFLAVVVWAVGLPALLPFAPCHPGDASARLGVYPIGVYRIRTFLRREMSAVEMAIRAEGLSKRFERRQAPACAYRKEITNVTEVTAGHP
jgi:hypothetical protein